MAMTREEFLKRRVPLPKVLVVVPELGEGAEIYVGKLTAKGRNRLEEIVSGGRTGAAVNLRNLSAKIVTLVCVDDSGNQLFTESDEEAIGLYDWEAVQRIVQAAFDLNGMLINPIEDAAGK
jgi:hypothetical protein